MTHPVYVPDPEMERLGMLYGGRTAEWLDSIRSTSLKEWVLSSWTREQMDEMAGGRKS